MSITPEYAKQMQLWEDLMNRALELHKDHNALVILKDSLPSQNLTESQRETITIRINRVLGQFRSKRRDS